MTVRRAESARRIETALTDGGHGGHQRRQCAVPTAFAQAFYNQEKRNLFVYLEYVGYLRRNPDAAGFVFWLGKLNQFNSDPFAAEMVRSFILSPEYRSRFGPP